ncbi:MrcB family domain-containing protein [Clostridium sardiniense]|uniref:MrcB family domain-containing protein n=1 Tax=Clostridium sardiniense TaxID=29369 RepID=UPI003D3552B9
MRKKLLNILENYILAKEENFKNNKLEQFIRLDLKQDIYDNFNIDNDTYEISGSAGVGRWANVPWIAVFDKEITKTATKGYYIVYLFCSDMSGVYLSLNQGWTYYNNKYSKKEARQKIKLVSDVWRAELSSKLKDFSKDRIDLKSNSKTSDLARGYELGHICGKYYSKDNIPDDRELLKDLNNLLGVYRELKGKMKETIETTNNWIILNSELDLIDNNITDDYNDEDLDKIIDTVDEFSLTEIDIPDDFLGKDKKYTFKPNKTNFNKKYKNQKRIGYLGEIMVLNYEKEYLIKNNRKDLANKIKHISKEEGDGAGYDILSYNLDGSFKYIEVKTTSGKGNTQFYLSANEIAFSAENADKFFLYRVCEFNKKTNSGKLFKFKGNIREYLNLEATQYVTNGIKNL